MIRCVPQGFFSWDYLLEGESHRAAVEFMWASEQGRIVVDRSTFAVVKHGVLSGHWTLEQKGAVVASAQKPSAMERYFEIEGMGERLKLGAASFFTRTLLLERQGETIARIEPDHAFTRRASITTSDRDCDFSLLCFAFWLGVVTWRRTSRSN